MDKRWQHWRHKHWVVSYFTTFVVVLNLFTQRNTSGPFKSLYFNAFFSQWWHFFAFIGFIVSVIMSKCHLVCFKHYQVCNITVLFWFLLFLWKSTFIISTFTRVEFCFFLHEASFITACCSFHFFFWKHHYWFCIQTIIWICLSFLLLLHQKKFFW